jgi:hypothetical protein
LCGWEEEIQAVAPRAAETGLNRRNSIKGKPACAAGTCSSRAAMRAPENATRAGEPAVAGALAVAVRQLSASAVRQRESSMDPTTLTGWQFLNQILPGLPGDIATQLANAKVDPTTQTATVSFGGGTLCGFSLTNGVVGISFANPASPSLFITGTVTTPISSGYPADLRGVFSSAKDGSVNAVFSGTSKESFPTVPIVDLTLSDPVVIIGVNSLKPTIPTVGAGGDMTLKSLDISGLMLFDSSSPKNCVLVASVSKLSLETVAESFPGVNSVPEVMKPLLSSVSLAGPSGEGFSIDVTPGTTYAGLADDLDAAKLDRVSAAFNQNGVTLPTDANQVALVVRSAGEKWSITNLQDDTHRHYQLTKTDGNTIQVTVDAQIYIAPSGATVAGNSFKQGMAVRGYVDILGIGGNVDLAVNTDFSLNESYGVDIGSVSIPGVSVIPGFSIDIGTVSVGVSISTGSASLSFSAAGVGFSIPLTAGATAQDQVIDAIKDHFTPDPGAYAAAAANFFKNIGEAIGGFFTGGGQSLPSGPPPDPTKTTSQQIADWITWFNNFCHNKSLPRATANDCVTQFGAWGFMPSQLVGPLKQNGYSPGDIGGAIMMVYQMPVVVVAQLLNGAGFSLGDVAPTLALYCDGGWAVMAKILVGAGYDVNAVANLFTTSTLNMRLSAAETISFLGEAGQQVPTQWPDDGTLYVIVPAAGLANPIKRLLGYDDDARSLGFFNSSDQGTAYLQWFLNKVADGVYTIHVGGSPSHGGLLSCHEPGNAADGTPLTPPANLTTVDVFSDDDGSGRQQWTLTPVGDGSFTITIEKPGALQSPSYKYLSCPHDGSAINLWNQDDGSGRQNWRLLPAVPVRDYTIQVGASAGFGTYLVDNGAGGVALSRSAKTSWTFGWGYDGIYQIRPQPANSYLSCNFANNPTGNINAVNLYSKDDDSGRQQWTLRATNNDSFTATIEKRNPDALQNTDYKYLSGPANLSNADDGSGWQRWTVSWAAAASLGAAGWPQMAQTLIKNYDVGTVADCFRTYRFLMSLSAAEAGFVLTEAGYKVTT